MGLYSSLATSHSLCGFELGNRFIPGCLSDDETSRIHSCEPGEPCSVFENDNGKMVWIIPIVNRAEDGSEVFDVGAGGGMGDLCQSPELEVPDKSTMEELERLCREYIRDAEVLDRTRAAVLAALGSTNKTLSLDTSKNSEGGDISLEKLLEILCAAHSDDIGDVKKLLRRPDALNGSNGEQKKNDVIVCIRALFSFAYI